VTSVPGEGDHFEGSFGMVVIFVGQVVTLAGMVVTLDRSGGMGLITLASRRRFEMPQRRMSMRRIKEVLRLVWIGGLTPIFA